MSLIVTLASTMVLARLLMDRGELHAGAETVSHMALSAGSAGVTISSLLRWTIDGSRTGWGEDQEVWSLPALREYRELLAATPTA